MQMHCNDRPPSLSQLDPTLSEGLARVVEKTLAKNPDARYANADELLADLVNLSRGRPTSLVVHPPLPQHDSSRVQQFVFQWEMGSSPAQLWPFVANTDRLNQAMGLPAARFTTQVDPERGVRRFAETRIAGQKIAWEEHPFEWIEGRRMSVLRQFFDRPVSLVCQRGRVTAPQRRWVYAGPPSSIGAGQLARLFAGQSRDRHQSSECIDAHLSTDRRIHCWRQGQRSDRRCFSPHHGTLSPAAEPS